MTLVVTMVCLAPASFIELYTRVMSGLETEIRRINGMISSTVLSGDHYFKLVRRSFQFDGRKAFEGAYSLVNEYSEIVANFLVVRKGLSELEMPLRAVCQRQIALGLPANSIQLFYTDNPNLALRLRPTFCTQYFQDSTKTHTLADDTKETSKMHLLRLPFKPIVASTAVSISSAINALERSIPNPKLFAAVGLDCEWEVDFAQGPQRLAVIQVSTETMTVVAQVSALSRLPPALVSLLANPSIVKAGRSINGDFGQNREGPRREVQIELRAGSVSKG